MKNILIMLIAVMTVTACKKNGTGGDARIHGHVAHHVVKIPNAIVYIKYNATEFPGADVSKYNASTQASSGDGHYSFDGLRAGEYYIYGVGYDSAISAPVFGGIGVEIKYSERKETIEVNVPVVE